MVSGARSANCLLCENRNATWQSRSSGSRIAIRVSCGADIRSPYTHDKEDFMKRRKQSLAPRTDLPQALTEAQLAEIKGGASMVEYALLLFAQPAPTK